MMRPTFRKLEVKDIGQLEKLIADNVEGIEPGLKVVDSRLLLGQAAIDLVGLDSRGSLALIALDFTAHEGLLLPVMDAYSWWLQFPDTLPRLYPLAPGSPVPPPCLPLSFFAGARLLYLFLRRTKHFAFFEFFRRESRHLGVTGEPLVFFDPAERPRNPPVVSRGGASPPPTAIAPAARVEP